MALVAVSEAWRGVPMAQVGLDAARAAAFASVPLLLGAAYAWIAARAATYTITNRRVVLRMGAALPRTMNLPFERIERADLRSLGSTGEIRLRLSKGDRMSSLMLWPHARLGRGEPTLRGLADADRAAQALSRALAASVDAPAPLAPNVRRVDTAGDVRGAPVAA